jgi:hypothetical protein
VRAAEDQRVDVGRDQGVEVLVGRGEQVVAPGDPRLDEVDEAGTGPGGQGDVGGRREGVVIRQGLGRGAGADDADPAVVRGGHGPAGGRQDHLDHGHVVPLAGVAQHGSTRGVAGDDQRLHAAGDEVVEALEGILADLGDRLRAVRLARGVAEVEQRLVGQLVDHRAGHGEPAEA